LSAPLPHTPLPWEIDGARSVIRSKTGVNARGGMTGGVLVAQFWTAPSAGDAAFFLAAVNARDDLVAALTDLIPRFATACRSAGSDDWAIAEALEQHRAALAKAEGRS